MGIFQQPTFIFTSCSASACQLALAEHSAVRRKHFNLDEGGKTAGDSSFQRDGKFIGGIHPLSGRSAAGREGYEDSVTQSTKMG